MAGGAHAEAEEDVHLNRERAKIVGDGEELRSRQRPQGVAVDGGERAEHVFAEHVSVPARGRNVSRPVRPAHPYRSPGLVWSDRQEIDQHIAANVAEDARPAASAHSERADDPGAGLREARADAFEEVAAEQAGVGVDLDRDLDGRLLPGDRLEQSERRRRDASIAAMRRVAQEMPPVRRNPLLQHGIGAVAGMVVENPPAGTGEKCGDALEGVERNPALAWANRHSECDAASVQGSSLHLYGSLL